MTGTEYRMQSLKLSARALRTQVPFLQISNAPADVSSYARNWTLGGGCVCGFAMVDFWGCSDPGTC